MPAPSQLVLDIVHMVAAEPDLADPGLADPALAGESYDACAVVAQITAGKHQLNAYGYVGDATPLPVEAPLELLDLFADLREATAGPNGETWEIAVLRLDLRTGRYAIEFVSSVDAGPWRVDPATFRRVAEAARPQSENFA